MREVGPAALRGWIGDGRELAILDAREEGEFGAGHLFWAVPCPLSRAELRLPVLLPRPGTRVVCVDDGGGLARRLAVQVEAMGGADVHVLAGGVPGWAAAGFVLFTGVHVPSKAFGEWVEHEYGTQSVDAAELKAWMDAGRDMVVLDSRPMDEFVRMSIPTGINVPGGELAYRIGDLVPDPATTIVVNCAGRTRSIMGAESLRRAGVPNPVVALRNGTMGWELAGLAVARGQTARYPEGRPRTEALAQQRAAAFAEQAGVGVIGPLDLVRFEDDPGRTLYVLDVRDPAEFARRHRPGSRNAPGGQLVQATDQWVAVRNARVVLIDDDGVRARMAGAWLRLMGHKDVFAVEDGLAGTEDLPAPPAPEASGVGPDAVEGALVLDLARSIDFRAGHIPGAAWGVRTRLAALRRPSGGGGARGGHLARRRAGPACAGRGARSHGGPGRGAGGRHRGLGGGRAWAGGGPRRAAGRGVRGLLFAPLRPQLGRGGGDARLSLVGGRPGARDRARRHRCLRSVAWRGGRGLPCWTCCCPRNA